MKVWKGKILVASLARRRGTIEAESGELFYYYSPNHNPKPGCEGLVPGDLVEFIPRLDGTQQVDAIRRVWD